MAIFRDLKHYEEERENGGEYKGRCLFSWDRKLPDGHTDKLMAVWDFDKNAPIHVLVQSTRFSTEIISVTDASPEANIAYSDWLKAQKFKRKFAAEKAGDEPESVKELRQMLKARGDLDVFAIDKIIDLYDQYGDSKFHRFAKLFNPKVRGSFKTSLRDQVLKWAQDTNSKFKTPLSPKQLQYV